MIVLGAFSSIFCHFISDLLKGYSHLALMTPCSASAPAAEQIGAVHEQLSNHSLWPKQKWDWVSEE